MNTNPMMIYFGQEFGEPGMDHEGFSGRDGRTTIFDYWSVGTIRRWRDGGKFDGRMLTDDEQRLHDVYQRVLTLCRQEEAIAHGLFFDLMYANIGGWRFNEHRQYAFLRNTATKCCSSSPTSTPPLPTWQSTSLPTPSATCKCRK